MKKFLVSLAVISLASAMFAGNTRVLVTVPIGTAGIAATTTVTSAILGTNSKYAEVEGVTYVWATSACTGTVVTTVLTANTNSLPVAATLGSFTASSTALATCPVVVGVGESCVVTCSTTNPAVFNVEFHLRTSPALMY